MKLTVSSSVVIVGVRLVHPVISSATQGLRGDRDHTKLALLGEAPSSAKSPSQPLIELSSEVLYDGSRKGTK